MSALVAYSLKLVKLLAQMSQHFMCSVTGEALRNNVGFVKTSAHAHCNLVLKTNAKLGVGYGGP